LSYCFKSKQITINLKNKNRKKVNFKKYNFNVSKDKGKQKNKLVTKAFEIDKVMLQLVRF
jgi:hypothetical protein